jgi:hypothetical protein
MNENTLDESKAIHPSDLLNNLKLAMAKSDKKNPPKPAERTKYKYVPENSECYTTDEYNKYLKNEQLKKEAAIAEANKKAAILAEEEKKKAAIIAAEQKQKAELEEDIRMKERRMKKVPINSICLVNGVKYDKVTEYLAMADTNDEVKQTELEKNVESIKKVLTKKGPLTESITEILDIFKKGDVSYVDKFTGIATGLAGTFGNTLYSKTAQYLEKAYDDYSSAFVTVLLNTGFDFVNNLISF